MGDDDGALERVGRARPPGLWIGGWVACLVVVVALAVAGRPGSARDTAVVLPVATASASPPPVAVASPSIPDSVPRIIRPPLARAPTPRPSPTLGDDGLVGGTSYSSASPSD